MARYDGRSIVINDDDMYNEVMRSRGINYARQFVTPDMKHPTSDEINELELVGHTWAVGDRFFKLAHEHYGDSEKWWVIAWFNQTPTEAHVVLGDTIYVPHPLARVLQILDV